MWIETDALQELRSKLRVGGILPPVKAVGALLALGCDQASLIATADWENQSLQSGSVTWSLLSKVDGGLSVVQASGLAWQWSTDARPDPEDAKLVAYWVPMREVVSVDIREVVADLYHGDLRVACAWRILLRDHEPIAIPQPSGDETAVSVLEGWMTDLRRALRSADSPS